MTLANCFSPQNEKFQINPPLPPSSSCESSSRGRIDAPGARAAPLPATAQATGCQRVLHKAGDYTFNIDTKRKREAEFLLDMRPPALAVCLLAVRANTGCTRRRRLLKGRKIALEVRKVKLSPAVITLLETIYSFHFKVNSKQASQQDRYSGKQNPNNGVNNNTSLICLN